MMISEKERRRNLISVLAVYFAANVIFITSPAMQAFSTELYPDIAYGTVLLLSTISSLFMIPGSLLAGVILGKQISFRQMAILSMGGIIIAGVLPFFIRAFAFVLVMRAIVGFCIGLGFPLQSTLALKLFDDEERPGVLGKATFVMALGSIVYMVLSGVLCDVDASYVWLIHGVLIVPLVLVLVFLKEPREASDTKADEKEDGKKEKLPGMAVFASTMFMIIFFAFYPMILNMSAIIDYENLGSGAVTGIISSLFTIGNALAGLIFARVYKLAGKYTVPAGLVLWIAGMAVFGFGHNLPMIMIGVIVSGIAAQIVWPGTVNSFSEYVPESRLSLASALFVSGMNLGCFLTSFFISGVSTVTGNDNPRLPCMIGLVIVIVFAAVWSVVEVKRKRNS